VSETLVVQSHQGPYTAFFDDQALTRLNAAVPSRVHFIIDAKVAGLYAGDLHQVLASPSVLLIEATEANKTLDKFTGYVDHLISRGVRRGQTLVAIGGGIMQDIVCFLAATLLRGMPWSFYPTTLLAQADSCIGSKSSINVGKTKNILGTFTPPEKIYITTSVLATLEEREFRSGLGEMLKVHAIDGPASFDRIAADYPRLFTDQALLRRYIYGSLAIKKAIIEADEFDRGVRNIMNYGHSFGHALESATDFFIPHGIAVTIGMDMANYTSMRLGLMDASHYQRMHPPLKANYSGFPPPEIPLEFFFSALLKDKKHTDVQLRLVLPDAQSRITVGLYSFDAALRHIWTDYLTKELYP
jgi:3-dehydroquinate synthase